MSDPVSFARRPGVQAVLAAAEPDPVVQAFLAALAGLTAVPYEALVVDERLVPPESLRFFFVDPNWIAAIQDGAMSLGAHTSLDHAGYAAIHERVKAGGAPAAAGLLLRSALVAGWPQLEVVGFADEAGATPIAATVTHLAADLLLCLFAAVPVRVDLREPAHGVRFGGEDPRDGQPMLALRSVGGDHGPVGTPLTEGTGPDEHDKLVAAPLRPGGRRVLDVAQAATMFAGQLGQTVGGAGFGLQLLRVPERQRFAAAAAAATTSAPPATATAAAPRAAPTPAEAMADLLREDG